MKPSGILNSKNMSTSIILMLLISLAMVPIVAEAEINSTGTYFWVDPKENIVEPYCTPFPVNIMIENAPETYAWEATLEFDNNTLGVMSISEGTWLSQAGAKNTAFYTTPLVDANKTGTMSFGCTLIGDVPGTDGSGLLCTIVFHVEVCGRSPLDLQDTILLDMDLKKTEYPNNDGFFCAVCDFVCLHDVAIIDVTVNATQVQQGEPVGITVIIKNQGNHTQHVNVTVYAERLTHNPADKDDVWVGDLGSKDLASGDPNAFRRVEYFIGKNSCTTIVPGQIIPVTFTWGTTPVAGEKYAICAEVVKTDYPDDDPHDNIFIGPVVHVMCDNDIKVVSITPTEIAVPQGKLTDISIAVKNEGLNTENLTVTVFAWPLGGTPFTNSIGSYNVENLAVNATDITIFTWNTTTVVPGIYVLGAIAAITTPGVTEKASNLADNQFVDGGIAIIIMDGAIIGTNLVNATVYRGEVAMVTVTLENQGTTMYRTPMAILCYNPGDIYGSLVGVITGITLGIGVNLTFPSFSPYGGFPTLPFPNGTYYVCVYLMPVPGWELDTADNGPVVVGTLTVNWKCGDANLDNKTNIMDKLRIDLALSPGTPYYDVDGKWPPADVNIDGNVNVMDKLRIDLILSPGTPYYGC